MDQALMMDGTAPADAQPVRLTPAGLACAVVIGIIGALVIFLTPAFLALVAQQSGFDNDQLGYLAAWDINAMGVTVGLSTFALSRVRWRLAVATGLVLIAAGNLLTGLAAGFTAMAAARVVAGAGEGIAIGFAFAALGRARNPDRAFSIYLVAGALFSSLVLYALPQIQAAFAPRTVFTVVAVASLLAILTLKALPDGSTDEVDMFAGGGALDRRIAFGSLVGVFLLFFAMGAGWSYSERIGIESAVPVGTIASGLSIGTMAGVVAAGLAGFLPPRWGRAGPLIVSAITGVIGFLMFRGQVSGSTFIIACVLMMFSWNFAQPLLSGICSEACQRGRVVCAMGSIQTFGTGLGPAAAAATLATGSFNLMLYACCVILVLSVVATIWATWETKKAA
ncbi:MFS transporter [Novosphingobium cyanobacteriorum]|uniref:MFS transporter n=1 Tax=Novosphingobium cyanobacteriorum TaxID=3024215 RepID=A0ABT6CIU6_9SPHN|nr:MFS transporter [Novosphingobium cyanobacteriorum]MDF8333721.1 MFS transporter [Novosphingobium cyanobacteriorum]